MVSPRALRPLNGASVSSQSGLIIFPLSQGEEIFSAKCVVE
jgi:hypothetical protein